MFVQRCLENKLAVQLGQAFMQDQIVGSPYAFCFTEYYNSLLSCPVALK